MESMIIMSLILVVIYAVIGGLLGYAIGKFLRQVKTKIDNNQ